MLSSGREWAALYIWLYGLYFVYMLIVLFQRYYLGTGSSLFLPDAIGIVLMAVRCLY